MKKILAILCLVLCASFASAQWEQVNVNTNNGDLSHPSITNRFASTNYVLDLIGNLPTPSASLTNNALWFSAVSNTTTYDAKLEWDATNKWFVVTEIARP